jgi:hypothetical protein
VWAESVVMYVLTDDGLVAEAMSSALSSSLNGDSSMSQSVPQSGIKRSSLR